MSDNHASLDGCGCFDWLKSAVFPTRKHGSTTSVAESPAAANSRTLVIVNNTPLYSPSPWEDWRIEGRDTFLRKWDAWSRKCEEENQPDSKVQNILEKIWKTLQGMLDKARERGHQVLQSELLKAALDLIPDNLGFPAGALIKALVQLILLGLVSSSLSGNCHISHCPPPQRLVQATGIQLHGRSCNRYESDSKCFWEGYYQ